MGFMTGSGVTSAGLEVLRDGGVNIDDLPPESRSALESLSEEEARVLLEVRRKFEEQGVTPIEDVNGNGVF